MKSLSVIIPTDGRFETLEYTLINTLTLRSVSEIIVLDSSRDAPTKKIRSLIDSESKIKYIKTSPEYNAVQNFNEGVKVITSECCVYIGDDDLLLGYLDDVMENWEDPSLDAIVTTFPVSYHWAGFQTKNQRSTLSETVVIRKYDGKIKIIEDPKKELEKASTKSQLGPQNLPRIYLGIVKSTIIKDVHSRYLGLFGGVSPDIYSSTLVAWHVKRYAIVDYPLIVPGAAKKSTTALSAEKKHTSRYEDSAHLRAFAALGWSASIPKLYTTQTVWAYSMQAALEKLGNGMTIDLKNLYLSFEIKHIELLRVLFTCALKNTKRLDIAVRSVFLALARSIVESAKPTIRKIIFNRRRNKVRVIRNIKNTSEAKKIIELEALKPPFLSVLRGDH